MVHAELPPTYVVILEFDGARRGRVYACATRPLLWDCTMVGVRFGCRQGLSIDPQLLDPRRVIHARLNCMCIRALVPSCGVTSSAFFWRCGSLPHSSHSRRGVALACASLRRSIRWTRPKSRAQFCWRIQGRGCHLRTGDARARHSDERSQKPHQSEPSCS